MKTVTIIAILLGFSCGVVCGEPILSRKSGLRQSGRTESFWGAAKVSESSSILTIRQPSRIFKKNDIITIIVTEVSKASGGGDLERERNYKSDFTINSWMRLVEKSGGGYTLRPSLMENGSQVKPKIDFEGGMKDDYSGAIKRQDKMEARIAAIVRDVKPNGNLVVEATRDVVLNREKVNITLSGIVRAEDVRADNTVPSYNIAMAKINYHTTGPASDGARRGWLTKIFDFVRPF